MKRTKPVKPANAPLTVVVDRDQLVIRIGVSTLAYAVQNGEDWTGEIIDSKGFARDVVNVLLDEREDGTTPVHLLLDAAAQEAANQGSIHLALGDQS